MSKRELIGPNRGDKRYVRRDDQGQFTDDQADVGRSLKADQRQDAPDVREDNLVSCCRIGFHVKGVRNRGGNKSALTAFRAIKLRQ
jgi:hypothetical protein